VEASDELDLLLLKKRAASDMGVEACEIVTSFMGSAFSTTRIDYFDENNFDSSHCGVMNLVMCIPTFQQFPPTVSTRSD
jgi:hypothetical protein